MDLVPVPRNGNMWKEAKGHLVFLYVPVEVGTYGGGLLRDATSMYNIPAGKEKGIPLERGDTGGQDSNGGGTSPYWQVPLHRAGIACPYCGP